MKLKWKTFIPSTILLLFVFLFLIKQKSDISIGGRENGVLVSLPILVKLMALKEREECFKVWINEIIARSVHDPEEKIDRIFDFLCRFEGFKNEKFPVGGNVEQHEYYTLIKQYSANSSDLIRVFCVLVSVAGYQAIPFKGEADGRVIVRIPSSDEWLYYDLKNRTSKDKVEGIHLGEDVKKEMRAMDCFLRKKGHTRGDKNLLNRRIVIELLKSSPYVTAVDDNKLIFGGR